MCSRLPCSLSGNVARYDTVYGVWSTALAPMPVPHTRFAFAASADTLYVVGGIGGDTGTGSCWDPTCPASGRNMFSAADVGGANPGRTGWRTQAFNVTSGVWRSDAALAAARLNVPRSDSCAAVIGGKVYVVGASHLYVCVVSLLG